MFYSIPRFKLLSVLLTTVIFSSVTQSKSIELNKEQRKEVIEGISKIIIENYVFPKVAQKNANFIQEQFKSGKYREIIDASKFAEQLTIDLQKINHDKHMEVRVKKPQKSQPEQMQSSNPYLEYLKQEQKENYGFKKIEILEGNVGYIDFRYFSGFDSAKETVDGVLKVIKNTDAVIFDLRKNDGGSPEMVQYICSYFFGEKTHLNSLYWRKGNRTQEFWTLDELPSERMPDVPLFVLTSKYTFSGAEEFAYNFKTRKRATIVGESTGGGANPGGPIEINELFSINVPTGRAINPITQTNWEGTGVLPNIKTSSTNAFDKAYLLAKSSAEKYRKHK
ncbi:S41 family peptidase [Pseudoalteromonas sp.]|uniref:S41 family peptidase n=1 Tax=Pseudoalteromonas sp. TaxID=53249 RepID=UPI00300135DB